MSSQYLAVIKQDYSPLVSEDEEVIPANTAAYKFGLMALLKEDAQDFVRSEELWNLAYKQLTNQVGDDEGDGAQGAINRADDFAMSNVGNNSIWDNGFYPWS